MIVVDSEDITISSLSNEKNSGGMNVISGRVMHTVYEGRKWRLMIHTAGGRITILHHEPLALDSEIYLEFKAKDTVIFPHQVEKAMEFNV